MKVRMNTNEHYYEHQKFFEFLDKLKIESWHWISLSILIAGADFTSGSDIQFPILYLLPIVMAAWFSKRTYALVLAGVLPCLRLIFHLIWNFPWPVIETILNIVIRIAVFVIIAYLISFVRQLQFLRGFLHICGYCGRIKNDDGNWISLQEYIVHHSEVMLSHGICPDCAPNVFK
jgi:hypothetical protein